MNRAPVCNVCGGTDYYNDAGYYYCRECNTQTQEMREEVFEIPDSAPRYTQTTLSKKPRSEADSEGSDWTTWEAYNYIMKGLTEEAIKLGAPPTLKIAVLQLWVRYFNKLGVAFKSKTAVRMPKLGAKYSRKDAHSIYGLTPSKKKRKRKKTDTGSISETSDDSSVTSAYSRRSFTKSRRKVAEEQYRQEMEDSQPEAGVSLLDDATSITSGVASASEISPMHSPKHSAFYGEGAKYYTSEARSLIRQRKLKAADEAGPRKYSRMCHYNVAEPSVLTRSKLLGILYMGLLITNSEIQIADLLRWIREEVLSYRNVLHFLPAHYKLKGSTVTTFGSQVKVVTASSLRQIVVSLAEFIQMTSLTGPNMLKLVKKYLSELQLPDSIMSYVSHLIAALPRESCTFHLTKFLNIENRAMALIIIVLKLLLGLDGETEHKNSTVARKLNKLLTTNPPLFVWDDWVCFIEARRAVLCHYHFPTHDQYYRNDPGSGDLFLDRWDSVIKNNQNKSEELVEYSWNTTKMDRELVSAMKHIVKRLESSNERHSSIKINFLPSLTPQVDYLKSIQASGIALPDILKSDFSSSTLDFLVRPDQYVTLAKRKKIKLVISRKSANKRVELVDGFRVPHTSSRKLLKLELTKQHEGVSQNIEPNAVSSQAGSKQTKITRRNKELAGKTSAENPLLKNVSCEEGNTGKTLKGKRKVKSKIKVREVREQLLNEYLRKYNINNELDYDGSNTQDALNNSNGEEEVLTVFVPYKDYWSVGGDIKKFVTYNTWTQSAYSTFSPSFFWLLKECSSILETSTADLYAEVLAVEDILAKTSSLTESHLLSSTPAKN